jgi:HK97 family phage major capsid protein
MTKLLSAARFAALAGVPRHNIFASPVGPRILLEAPIDQGVDLKSLTTQITAAADKLDKLREIGEKALSEAQTAAGMATETKAKAAETLNEFNGLKTALDARIGEIEQRVARGGNNNGGGEELKTLGQVVIESDDVKALMAAGPRSRSRASVGVDLKTVLSATGTWGSTTSVGTSLVAPDRAGLVPLPQRRMTVRDLITPGETNSNAIEYAKETVFTNNAAVVAENTRKPESNIVFDMTSTAVRTVAHFIKASRNIMDDAPQLRSIIDQRLRYGLMLAEEAELLYGDGTGQHLLGIIPQATAYSAAFSPTDTNSLDILLLAALQSDLALLPASGYVLHPTDWARIQLTKDGMGQYIVGGPQQTLLKTLWGLPVVTTMAITAGTFLSGAFQGGAQLFDRMAIEVLLSTENEDDFVKNMLTIRAEERLALAVYRAAAFITGSIIAP